MNECKLMIYGAYGYAGELMVREAVKQGIEPVIAGLAAAKLKPIADELGLEYRAFAIPDAANHLQGIGVLLNCAGPFSATADPMVRVCLDRHVHYLDITGEIEVFRSCYAQDAEARERGIIVMPGVGTDIVPTDCLAAMLKERVPAATRLDLAFCFGTAPSIGTVKTSIESLGKGGLVRENNRLRTVPNGFRMRKIPFQDGAKWAVTIPWGDVFTTGISTGVPDGVVYMAMSRMNIWLVRMTNPFKKVIGSRPAQNFLKKMAGKFVPKGPDEQARQSERGQFWGEATAPGGEKAEMTMSTPNVYALTVVAGIRIAEYCLGYIGPGGYYTPSMLLSSHFIDSIPGVDIRTL